jgi:hypothetical protein
LTTRWRLPAARADATIQSSLVNAGALDHPITGEPVLAFVTYGAAKLRDIFTAAGGAHDDWDAYDRTMLEQRRTAVFVVPSRIYST